MRPRLLNEVNTYSFSGGFEELSIFLTIDKKNTKPSSAGYRCPLLVFRMVGASATH